jgi:uncharacterized protein (DUF1501 family)
MKRREFIQSTSAAVSLPVFLNGIGLTSVSHAALFNAINLESDRVLVLVQLNGGNDGLSTVLPLDQYSNLANARPNILVPESSGLIIEDNVALHEKFEGIRNLYTEGKVGIINSVGYPDQNRSHFRSTDIWTSGSPSDEVWTTGWLGRLMDDYHPDYPSGYPNIEFPAPLAITMGSLLSSTCQGAVTNLSLALNDPFELDPLNPGIEDDVPSNHFGQELVFLRQTVAQTNAYSSVITDAANLGTNMAEYPENNDLATQLKNIALMISGGLQTKIYIANIGGFDTHANQVFNGLPLDGNHQFLLDQVSTAIEAFQQDLEMQGLEERVVGMTFSEFGRRIRSNDSFGTDHGTAGPMFLFGSCVNPGIIGHNPEIPEQVGVLDGVPMQYDFRDVYGSLLMDWFEVSEDMVKDIIYQDFTYMPIVNVCNEVINNSSELVFDVPEITVYPNPFRDRTMIRFETEQERARLSVFNTIGGEVAVLFDKELQAGKHEVPFDGRRLAPGTYYIRLLLSGGRQQTKMFVKS